MVNSSQNSAKLFGLRLRDARVRNALSQKDLADRLGVVQPTISTWELGEATPRKKQLTKLADIFDLVLDIGNENDSHEKRTPSFRKWLMQTRKARGLSVPELAKMAKISDPTIYNLQRGKTKNPHPQTVKALERALGAERLT